MEFEYSDASQQWFEAVMETHQEEARSRAASLIAEGIKTDAGCIETPTLDARKVRFKGRPELCPKVGDCVFRRLLEVA
jgi:hypothetical protein